MNATTADQTTVMRTPSAWVMSWPAMEKSSLPVPPRLGAENTPVSNAPRMPPTPCTPKTSSESSAPSSFFRPFTPQKQTTPAARPMTMAPIGPTEPQAGVMATSPATAPEAAPSIEGLPLRSHSANIQDKTAEAVAKSVFTKASAAPLVASRLEPALKPNQPTHSIEAPTIVSVRLCGVRASRP